MKVHPYLNYGGNCEEAFRFYEKHLGGEIISLWRHDNLPDQSGVPEDWKKAIVFARIVIGGTVLMGNDVPPERFKPIRSAYLSLAVDSIEEAERVYALLSESGETYMPMEETFYAFRFAMLRDRFGTSWMIVYERTTP